MGWVCLGISMSDTFGHTLRGGRERERKEQRTEGGGATAMIEQQM